MLKISEIEWDIDEPLELEELPEEMNCPEEYINCPWDEISGDEIANAISDHTGFCHTGFQLTWEGDGISLSDAAKEVEEWLEIDSCVYAYRILDANIIASEGYRFNIWESDPDGNARFELTVTLEGKLLNQYGRDSVELCLDAYDNDPDMIKKIKTFKEKWYKEGSANV